jgi:putative transposase
LEVHRLRTGISWYGAKTSIIREAIRDYLAHPRYKLGSSA